jgi:hypothetical protein
MDSSATIEAGGDDNITLALVRVAGRCAALGRLSRYKGQDNCAFRA